METNINKGVIINGGTPNIQNMATGDNAIINNKGGLNVTDFELLTHEITKLRLRLLELSDNSPENFQVIAEVANAEVASKAKDENKVVKHLKAAGQWVFDIAKEIGVDIVTDLIKKQI
jgi:hypothetical protein